MCVHVCRGQIVCARGHVLTMCLQYCVLVKMRFCVPTLHQLVALTCYKFEFTSKCLYVNGALLPPLLKSLWQIDYRFAVFHAFNEFLMKKCSRCAFNDYIPIHMSFRVHICVCVCAAACVAILLRLSAFRCNVTLVYILRNFCLNFSEFLIYFYS